MDIPILLTFFFVLFILELIYFKIADKYNIIDKPNYRSSHTEITIRGGGIIFSLALFVGASYYGWQYSFFLSGLLIISFISFLDDIKPVTNKTRIICHLIAVALLFHQLNLYALPFYWIVLAFIFVIGTINAVNFMDGINGMTGVMGLVTLLTLYYINQNIILFTSYHYLILGIISLLIFIFFNFRKVARCFAGDVGSVSLAFIMVFFFLELITKTNNLNFLLVLLVYGLDVVTTIFFRLIRRENIFNAHRSHFYQFLANEKKVPHLWVALIYGFIQLIINYVIINILPLSVIGLTVSIFISAVVFVLIRWYFEGSKILLNKPSGNS